MFIKSIKERSRDALEQSIKAAGIPFDGISSFPPVIRLDFQATATDQQKAQAAAIAAAWDWSDAAQLSRESSALDTKAGIGKIQTILSALDAGTATPVQVQKVLAFLLRQWSSAN